MKKSKIIFLATGALGVFLFSCSKLQQGTGFSYQVPTATPVYQTFFTDEENWRTHLGRILFYDPQLSAANTIACASCHKQSHAFADDGRFSMGVRGKRTERNAPAILRMGPNLFWDGRSPDLNALSTNPIENHLEMGIENFSALEEKLGQLDYYKQLFSKANLPINKNSISACLTQFMTQMLSNKNFNVWNTMVDLGGKEELGRKIFNEKGRCSNCHSGNNLDGWGQLDNIGLDYEYKDKGALVKIDSSNFEPLYGEGFFRIPSLINIKHTGPYMHDGRFNTLEEVVDHYNSGIKKHKNLSLLLRQGETWSTDPNAEPVRLGLTEYEKECLVAFLNSLTDETVRQNPMLSNPF